jgi:predicted kinase
MNRRIEPGRFSARKRRLLQPSLILIMGVAGSGKTTLAREILTHIWAVYLDNNHIVDAFFPHTRTGQAYEKMRPNFYKALYTITEENLKLGMSVLLDVPHIKEVQTKEWRNFIKRLVKRTKAKAVIIRCLCSEKTLHSRISSRGEQRDQWKLDNWNEFLRTQPIKVPIPFRHLDIDTGKRPWQTINAAIRYILSQAGRPSSKNLKLNDEATREKLTRILSGW